ncbi:heavy-metal-associated domain-containing protein [Ulvibacterium sp.]|uniref:heavy-metal-associated domain-containing protein n=1 Tax=Ulvibacterium sp. TaxID=2665914 RepID=UPI0026150092|nr:heavy metal-associated domain-containing protein [Ulvibacterium sp.]
MKTSIIVQNLKCNGCATTIAEKLSGIDDISKVEVDTESSTVSFLHENNEDALMAKNTLTSLGYPAVDSKNSLAHKTRSFVSCAMGRLAKS